MNKKTIYYLLVALAIIVLPMAIMCCSGCDQPQQVLPLPHSCQIVLQVFTIQDGTCGTCERDKPGIEAIQRSGFCQVEIIDAEDPRSAGIRDFPEYRVYVNGSFYYRTNNLQELYGMVQR